MPSQRGAASTGDTELYYHEVEMEVGDETPQLPSRRVTHPPLYDYKSGFCSLPTGLYQLTSQEITHSVDHRHTK